MRGLSRAQQQDFESEGFVVVEDVLDPDQEIAGVLAEYADALDEIATDFLQKGLIESTHRELGFTERLIRVSQESGQPIPQFFDFSLPQTGIRHDTPIRVGPAVFRLLTTPRLLDLVEDVVGTEIYSNPVQHIRMKLPKRAIPEGFSSGLVTQIPWHQDNGVILPEADDASILTVWLPLLDATVDNGCLRVIPRSHHDKVLHEHLHEDRVDLTLNQRMAGDVFDETQAVDVELEPGQMSLHDVYMIHGAAANRSGKRRTGVALRYMPATSVFERHLRPADGKTGVPVDFAHRPLWLVKGVDRSGRNDFRVGHRTR